MFELLEDLDPKVKKRFQKEVSMTEITRYALNLHPKATMIITNKMLYLLTSGWFFMSVWKRNLQQVSHVEVSGSTLTVSASDGKTSAKIAPGQLKSAQKLAEVVNSLLKERRC